MTCLVVYVYFEQNVVFFEGVKTFTETSLPKEIYDVEHNLFCKAVVIMYYEWLAPTEVFQPFWKKVDK